MAKKQKMTEAELLIQIEGEERSALDYLGGELADQRAENMELYLGEKTRELSPVDGRSSVVSMDVQEAVESMMPYLMKVFTSGDEVVRFDPVSAEDVEPAEQETDYVNHVVINQNNFFLVGTQWIKDALINKNAYVKCWWDESKQVTEERYQGLSDVELQMLLQDPNVEAIEHDEYPDEQSNQQLQQQIAQAMQAAQMGDPQAIQAVQQLQQMPPVMLHDVKVKVTNTKGKCAIEPCPPEEVLVSSDERSIDPNTTRFFEHRTRKTISELRDMGYDIPDDIPDEAGGSLSSIEWTARNEFNELETDDGIGANRKVLYRECYYNIDYDGDGISERRQICLVGDKILNNEPADLVPFACITPYVMPHRHVGRALADYVKDIQVIKSVILRNILDNFYTANNGRWAISNKVNLDDMLVSRPGGVVRMLDGSDPAGHILPMQASPLSNAAFPLMEYLDTNKETRTGITRYNQGLDANSLNKTASGINQIMNAAQAKQELIARTIAETGVKQLFLMVHKLLLQHSKKEEIVRIKNKWIPVDPRQWKTRTDMTVAVGLGTGNKQEMLVQIMQILGVQEKALMLGVATPENIYESCIELTKNAGFKDGDKYWTNPKENPPPPRPNPEEMKMQGQMQLKQQELQADAQKFQAEQQARDRELQLEAQKEQHKAEMDMQERQHDATLRYQLEQEKIPLEEAKLQLEKYKTDADNQTRIIIAKMNAHKDTGEMMTEIDDDGVEQPSSAMSELVGAISTLVGSHQQSQAELINILSRPKTATLSNGKKVTIS